MIVACSRASCLQTHLLGDVPRDFRGADDHAGVVVMGDTVSEMAIGCRPCAAGSFRSASTARRRGCFASTASSSPCRSAGMIIRIDCPIASAAGVAEYPFGRRVPGRDDAVEVLADDGVVGRLDDLGEVAMREIAGWTHAAGHGIRRVSINRNDSSAMGDASDSEPRSHWSAARPTPGATAVSAGRPSSRRRPSGASRCRGRPQPPWCPADARCWPPPG